MTPLCASAWVPASELGLRAPFHAMGALSTARKAVPADPMERITNVFFGRMAVRVDFLCEIGDLIPGQSGEALARDFFGFVPPDFESRPSLRRLPAIAVRYPRTLLKIAKRLQHLRRTTDAWWRERTPQVANLSLDEARELLDEAMDRFAENLAAQAVISACAIQPVYEQLTNAAKAAGTDPAVLLRGQGSHEESAVLDDLWAVSRDKLDLETFLGRHGYHGPGEGELSTVVWRENPAPVLRLIEQYRELGENAAPEHGETQGAHESAAAERQLFGATRGLARLKARVLLRLARKYVPLRGVGKVSYLQALDVIRATARHIGGILTADGVLDEPDDAFYLTRDEFRGELDGDLRDLVARRRAVRARYQALEVPTAWTGRPTATPVVADGPPQNTLTGVGASSGTIEGRAVVVLDPSNADIDTGDILVAHTTDPAWVSLMFLAQALVVDIGGMLSHAAVVARELDIPCVMNTKNGTQVLRTGDRVRVDGTAGTVEILERAGGPTE
ncbi:phosphoenolpyruvate-utilizing protein [Amycolatopsis sp. K13G38]|uniref:Phosphoenolpyruvate-utilizing protein n=2 Tax=Amycolatopsis acididurans TaxID=2724524 RepID=A0ABX1J5I1_9PSEU|nr:phosphoenolpyruvate-utilizing protein [Amycolatopsis acididurans]